MPNVQTHNGCFFTNQIRSVLLYKRALPSSAIKPCPPCQSQRSASLISEVGGATCASRRILEAREGMGVGCSGKVTEKRKTGYPRPAIRRRCVPSSEWGN
ncbi:hypothetical protein AVEN_7308-1 [Araneus ventricosus]|uniref:Uncharacterized protein n=1 Tax=Araneus ventricosus TaxID=182803 RepID=A0A4Y2SER3_ARAVE|nr:hypothetical protein AVEN_7308-1 [Araneus ventricosus]